MKKVIIAVTEACIGNKQFEKIARLLISEAESVKIVSFDSVDETFARRKVRDFVPSEFESFDMNICFDKPTLAATRPRNVLITDTPKDEFANLGFVMVAPDAFGTIDEFLELVKKTVPMYTPAKFEIAPSGRSVPVVRDKRPLLSTRPGRTGGLSGEIRQVTLKNTTQSAITSKDLVVAEWCDAKRKRPITGAARTSSPAPAIAVGKKSVLDVRVPKSPIDAGRLYLHVYIERGKRRLGIDIYVMMSIRG